MNSYLAIIIIREFAYGGICVVPIKVTTIEVNISESFISCLHGNHNSQRSFVLNRVCA